MDIDVTKILPILCFLIGTGILIYIIKLIFSIGRYTKTIDAVEKDISIVKNDLSGIRKLLSQLAAHLIKAKIDIPESFVSALSPNRLTESGQKMLEESGLKNMIDGNKNYFFKQVESKKPPTKYDIEQLCYEVLLLDKDKENMKPAKEYAYNKGLDLNNMLYAVGIYLRDLIIADKLATGK